MAGSQPEAGAGGWPEAAGGGVDVGVVIVSPERLFGEALAAGFCDKDVGGVRVTTRVSDVLSGVPGSTDTVFLIDLATEEATTLRRTLSSLPGPAIVLTRSDSPPALGPVLDEFAVESAGGDCTLDDLVRTVERVQRRGSARRSERTFETPRRVAAGAGLRSLSPREREVLSHLARGRSTAALASDMGISYATARTHITNLLTKLGVHSKLAAVAIAFTEGGWSAPDDPWGQGEAGRHHSTGADGGASTGHQQAAVRRDPLAKGTGS